MKFLHVTVLVLFLSAFFFISQAAIAQIKIGGSSTVTNFVFYGNEDKIENKTGKRIEVLTSSSGRGLLALANGSVDIGMISSELPALIEKLNKKGHDLKEDDFLVYPVSQTKVIFLVRDDNPLEEITYDQMHGIMTGEITDWSELGYDDLGVIKVVTEHETGGIYNTLVQKGLDGEKITANKIMMQNGPQVAIVVSQMPNSFGFFSDATPPEQRKGIKIVKQADFDPIVQKMSFITLKSDTRPEVKDFLVKLLAPSSP